MSSIPGSVRYISYLMFIEPTITSDPSKFSGYIWLDTKIVLKNNIKYCIFDFRCSSGYYGNPSIVGGGGCRPCSCHKHGSHDQNCHPVTGQCSCVVGITGRACDKCQPRYAIMDGICKCRNQQLFTILLLPQSLYFYIR